MKNYDQPTRIFTELCRLYEKNDQSFYDVLDLLLESLIKINLIRSKTYLLINLESTKLSLPFVQNYP